MEESHLEVNNDLYFKDFIEKRRLSESTKIVYIGRIRSYCEFLDKSPSDLIKEAQKESQQVINKHFHDYIEDLKKSGKSTNTIINRIDTVKAFYSEYEIGIESLNKIITPETGNLANRRIISEDHIKEALELSSLRDKAIILLHMSSGMEATELRNLTYGDFINSIEEYVNLNPQDRFNINKIADELSKINEVVGNWKIEKNRTQKPYVTFNSPESTKAILSYLIDRERKNKPIKSNDDPLFVNSQNEALTVSAHGSIFKRINNRANFGYLTKKRRFFSSTMLRKYFKTRLCDSGLNESTVNAILGQKLDTNVNYHSDAQIKLLKDKYLSALGSLSLEKDKIEIVTSKEYKELINKLNEKDKELEEIRKHLNYIKEIIK